MRWLIPNLDRRVDGRAVGIARIVVGLAAFVKGLFATADVYLLRSGDYIMFPYGWQTTGLVETRAATVIVALWLVFSLFFTLGFGTRISGAMLALSIFLVIGSDQQLYSNHLYLLVTLVALLTIAGAGNAYSVDQRSGSLDQSIPWWSLQLIRLQLTSVYLFAALTKLNHDFLSGGVLEMALEPAMQQQVTNVVTLPMMASAAVATELFLAFAFWFRRVRWLALLVAIGFHIANVALMDHGGMVNFSIFGTIMIAMILLFFRDVLERALLWNADRAVATPDQAAPEAT